MPPRRGQLAPPKPPGSAPAVPQQQQPQHPVASQQPDPQPQASSGTTNLPNHSVAPAPTTPAQPAIINSSTTNTTTSAALSTSFPSAPPIPASFAQRKQTILAQLALPDEEYTDLSPKGTVDAGIRDLIDEINAVDGLVTTSSCAGRVSVFLEGRRGGGPSAEGRGRGRGRGSGSGWRGDDGGGGLVAGGRGPVEGEEGQLRLPGHPQADLVEEDDGGQSTRAMATIAGVGGKGGGGRWLFVSHDPVQMEGKLDSEPNIVGALLGMEEPIFDGRDGSEAEGMGDGSTRLIHFKFEPMILHVLTASPHHAQLVLRCGLQAGFRESGAINLIPPASSSSSTDTPTATPIVAIRSMGLGVESLIGCETNGIKHCTVSGEYLKALIRIANERFLDNARRIERFRTCLREVLHSSSGGSSKQERRKGDVAGGLWEDTETRKERKRAEGLRRAEEVRKMREELEEQQHQREREREREEECEQGLEKQEP